MVAMSADHDSLTQALRAARREAWSGRINVSVDDREVGAVVMRSGRVAWAICAEQPEDLGTFLWRLGRVTKEDLDAIRRRYAEHGGRRKLGALMEEAGVLPRNVLRRCLLLHTRRAMSCLSALPKARVRAERSELQVDEAMTFSLPDVAPGFEESGFPPESTTGSLLAGRWLGWNKENRVLGALADLPGYRASGVLAREGEVLAAHAAGNIDPVTVGVLVVSLLESSACTLRTSGLGSVSSLCLECDEGTIVTQWLDEHRSHVVVVLVESGANTGMARYKVGAEAPSLAKWVRERGEESDSRPARSGAGAAASGSLG